MYFMAPSMTVRSEQLFSLLARGGKPDFLIDGYPEYGTEASLDAHQRRVLRQVAEQIVQSRATMSPVKALLVVGHADKALRKAVNERAAFEQEISVHRATSARKLMLDYVLDLSQGAHYAKTLISSAIGVGNKHPVVANAASEAQMKKNRRVEIYLGQCMLTPPLCRVAEP